MFQLFRTDTIKRGAVCLAAMFCLAVSSAAPAGAIGNQVRVGIQNDSSYDIYQIYMSYSGDDNWGPDLLRDTVLITGNSVMVTASPGKYDLKLVDEDGDTCTVMGLQLYGNESWSITNRWLLSCEFHQTR